jgi:CDGSH-type Zn-finger protein
MSDLPKCAQKAPYVQDAAAGRYAFCTCGLSDKQPFCNGAHRTHEGGVVRVQEIRQRPIL